MAEFYIDYTDEAAELMKKADAGDAEAQYKFATYLLREPDYSVRDDLHADQINRAITYLQKAAAQGYFDGLVAGDLGDIYYHGKVVPKDYKKAKLWYNTALLKNHPPAAYMLGECAYYGYEEAVDYKKAADYYIKAAPEFVDAVIRLGDMYMQGEYFSIDRGFARMLFEYVLQSEDWLFKKYGFYSAAHKMALLRMDELERNDRFIGETVIDETEEQAAIRAKLLEIIENDKY